MKNNLAKQGKILCKGSGLKVYFQLTLNKRVNGKMEYKTFTYEVGTVQQILSETNRQTSWNFVAGRRNAVSVNKGLRNSYGTITFAQMDQGQIYAFLEDVRKWSANREYLEPGNLQGFSFTDYTFNEQDAALISGPSETQDINVYIDEVVMLDDLPPVDIIVLGAADQIDEELGQYDINKTYMFKCLKTTFLSETFGISAGAPLHNVATKVLFLGGIEPWRQVDEEDLALGKK